MRDLATLQSIAASDYQSGMAVLNHIGHMVRHCTFLLEGTAIQPLGPCDGKDYHVFRDGANLSRPVHLPLLIRDPQQVQTLWSVMCDAARPQDQRYDMPPADINVVLYSVSMAFAICYDLWRPSSRKTPGTFLEIVVGSLLQVVLPDRKRIAHISLRDGEKVATDIAFLDDNGTAGLVVPVKITTRERIVQPFAHQRILDSVFGEQRFRSVMVCVSEMQRKRTEGANAICVPGTIRLFQRHLASLSGLYYLDPPQRYLQPDVTAHVSVRTVGDLFAADLPSLLHR